MNLSSAPLCYTWVNSGREIAITKMVLSRRVHEGVMSDADYIVLGMLGFQFHIITTIHYATLSF